VLIKSDPRIDAIDMVAVEMLNDQWIDGWSPQNIVHYLKFDFKKISSWNATHLDLLIASLPHLTALRISCNTDNVTDVFKVIGSSSIQEFALCSDLEDPASFHKAFIHLSTSKLKSLSIPRLLSEYVQIEHLEGRLHLLE
jgi:hypothetical protein